MIASTATVPKSEPAKTLYPALIEHALELVATLDGDGIGIPQEIQHVFSSPSSPRRLQTKAPASD
jgi:hypothetical protein